MNDEQQQPVAALAEPAAEPALAAPAVPKPEPEPVPQQLPLMAIEFCDSCFGQTQFQLLCARPNLVSYQCRVCKKQLWYPKGDQQQRLRDGKHTPRTAADRAVASAAKRRIEAHIKKVNP